MILFSEDIFNTKIPTFTTVLEKADIDFLRDLIKKNYPQIFGESLLVFQNQGNEVNASNFRIQVDTHEYALKKFKNLKDEKLLRKIIDLTAWLTEKNNPFPFVFENLQGETITFDQERYGYCVSEFKHGRYFSGESLDECDNVAKAIGRMAKTINSCPQSLYTDNFVKHYNSYKEIFQEMEESRDKWPLLFGEELAFLLKSNWKLIIDIYSEVLNFESIYASLEKKPFHIDLHPHNILIQDKSISCFLDIDSFCMDYIFIPISFGFQKLVRQSICSMGAANDQTKFKAIVNRFYEGIRSEFPNIQNEFANLNFYSNMEILRRINGIFGLNLKSQNRKWNHVLNIQVKGLMESKLIFDNISK